MTGKTKKKAITGTTSVPREKCSARPAIPCPSPPIRYARKSSNRVRGAVKRSKTDWRSIENDKEKYQAYLCSREWATKRTAVHTRANGICERCGIFAIDAVHHLTYARKYDEQPEDLQGTCRVCHAFTHGKTDWDPNEHRKLALYIRWCRIEGLRPLPIELQGGLKEPREDIALLFCAITQLIALAKAFPNCARDELENALKCLNNSLGFDFARAHDRGIVSANVVEYANCLSACGYEAGVGDDNLFAQELQDG